MSGIIYEILHIIPSLIETGFWNSNQKVFVKNNDIFSSIQKYNTIKNLY